MPSKNTKHSPERNERVTQFIEKNYDKIRKMADYCFRNHTNFAEDLFHEGLIALYESQFDPIKKGPFSYISFIFKKTFNRYQTSGQMSFERGTPVQRSYIDVYDIDAIHAYFGTSFNTIILNKLGFEKVFNGTKKNGGLSNEMIFAYATAFLNMRKVKINVWRGKPCVNVIKRLPGHCTLNNEVDIDGKEEPTENPLKNVARQNMAQLLLCLSEKNQWVVNRRLEGLSFFDMSVIDPYKRTDCSLRAIYSQSLKKMRRSTLLQAAEANDQGY